MTGSELMVTQHIKATVQREMLDISLTRQKIRDKYLKYQTKLQYL